jgi:DNA-binding response OmpR family regulator
MITQMPHRLLLVEDDDQIAAPLIRTLEREDYVVTRAANGLDAIELVAEGSPDLVLLDLGLPDVDGLEVCRRVRAAGFQGAIMILTARGGELDRVVGLDVGADDYLAKPFGLAELLARVRALLRRAVPVAAETTPAPAPATSSSQPAGPASHPDAVRIEAQARRVWVGGRQLSLTAKEFDVIALLGSEPGAVLTRERVMDEVWDENWFGSTKALDATIGRLRQKLEESGTRSRVETVRGVGFRLEIDPPDA